MEWKRPLVLGLGPIVALALTVALPASASAASTLTGENFSGSSASGNSHACNTPTFSASGTATGPYAGTFTEAGSWSVVPDTFGAQFTITSGTTTIIGSKSGSLTAPGDAVSCKNTAASAFAIVTDLHYSATIHSPSGVFHDEGKSTVQAEITGAGAATLTENFTSSLAQPLLIAPTSKKQCKHGGWRNFPQFKNQGRCVSYVQGHRKTSSLAQPVPVAPTSKDRCKNNGWKNFPQFKNQGQCVSSVQGHRKT